MASDIPPPPSLSQVTGLRWLALYVAGFFLLGMAFLGAMLPGLPTVPWLLGASGCFARTSPRLQHWIWYSPLFGPLLRDFYLHRGMRLKSKLVAVPMVVVAVTFSTTRESLLDWLRVLIGVSGLVGVCVILFAVPTVREVNARVPERGA